MYKYIDTLTGKTITQTEYNKLTEEEKQFYVREDNL